MNIGLTACAVLTFSVQASAAVIWNEAVHGDLSGDPFNPTAVNLSLGSNSLLATSVSGDREYIRMTIPAGMQLVAILHAGWVSDDPIAFIAVQSGPVMTEPPTGTNPANLLGWTHFGVATFGQDILPAVGAGPMAIGFTPPLPAGTYTFWIQQTGPLASTYELDFQVVPVPGSAAMVGLGCLLATRRRRPSTC